MLGRSFFGSLVLAAAVGFPIAAANAFDETKYPDWKGQWVRIGGGQYDPSKPPGQGQGPPLTAEYQAVWEASLRDQASGGPGNDPAFKCIPSGMPRAMIVTQPMEIVITPAATYIMLELHSMLRRIYTDGRDFPKEVEPQFMGYAIGQWVDEDDDGRYDTLLVETRFIKGPHSYDNSGIPLHADGNLVVQEKIYLDTADKSVLHNEITVVDNALTRPWTVKRSARRETDPNKIAWTESICAEDNRHVQIGKEGYMIDPDGLLMPVRPNQPAPDLRYFPDRR